jgi:hypothetical protein
MVLNFYGEPSAKQCTMVGRLVDDDGVCMDPDNEDFDVPCQPEDMRQVWRDAGVQSRAHLGTTTPGWLDANDMVDELDEGRPVQVGLKWRGSGGHAIIVQGWRYSSQGIFFFVNDPLDWTDLPALENGRGQIHYDELREAYGLGDWKWSWTKLAKMEG